MAPEWTTPYGTGAKYYRTTDGSYSVEWDDADDMACPSDWLTADGPTVAAALRREGFSARGRWQVRRLFNNGTSEAMDIAPTLTKGQALVAAYYDKEG